MSHFVFASSVTISLVKCKRIYVFFFLFLKVVNFFMSYIEEACQKKVSKLLPLQIPSCYIVFALYQLINSALKGKRDTNRRKPRTAGPLELSTAQPYHYLMMELVRSYRGTLTLHSVRFLWSIDVPGSDSAGQFLLDSIEIAAQKRRNIICSPKIEG